MKKIRRGTAVLLLVLALLPRASAAREEVVPGGDIIGIEIETRGVAIVEFSRDTPEQAGLRRGDILKKFDGKAVHTPEEVRQLVESSGGAPMHLTVERKEKEKTVVLAPADTEEGLRLGLMVRDRITGIGTVTYFDPEANCFGALGHGVNGEGGLLPMEEGSVLPAAVSAVEPGREGDPGSLRGSLQGRAPLGEIERNTGRGIFGKMPAPARERVPVAQPGEVRTGKAEIRTTVAGREIQDYDVQILAVYSEKDSGRNLLLEVTDPELLEITGGIVQGMSGSPILQNGKLVGAVTHVLIDNPARGYGIFIENMLDAAA